MEYGYVVIDDASLPMPMPHHGRVGSVLAAARGHRGVDLVDVARETRVPLRHLKAIEADTHDGLPALPYTLGFVRSYARFLGLDPEPLVTQFKAETTKTAHVPAHAPLEPLDARRLPSKGIVTASVAALVVLLAGAWAWSAGWFAPAPAAPPVEIAAAEAPDAAVPTAEDGEFAVVGAPAAPVAPTLANPVPVAAGSAPAGAVTLTPTEDVWVRIYPVGGGASIKSGILKGGERFVVPGDPAQLLIRTGKAGVLGLAVNGRPVAPLGGPVETVSDASLDPARLAARPASIATPAPAVG